MPAISNSSNRDLERRPTIAPLRATLRPKAPQRKHAGTRGRPDLLPAIFKERNGRRVASLSSPPAGQLAAPKGEKTPRIPGPRPARDSSSSPQAFVRSDRPHLAVRTLLEYADRRRLGLPLQQRGRRRRRKQVRLAAQQGAPGVRASPAAVGVERDLEELSRVRVGLPPSDVAMREDGAHERGAAYRRLPEARQRLIHVVEAVREAMFGRRLGEPPQIADRDERSRECGKLDRPRKAGVRGRKDLEKLPELRLVGPDEAGRGKGGVNHGHFSPRAFRALASINAAVATGSFTVVSTAAGRGSAAAASAARSSAVNASDRLARPAARMRRAVSSADRGASSRAGFERKSALRRRATSDVIAACPLRPAVFAQP